MKRINSFINERLIVELDSKTYLNAAYKAKDLGDRRFKKFLNAYAEEVEKESTGSKEVLNDYYQQDKKAFTKLNKIGKVFNDGSSWDFGEESVSLTLGAIDLKNNYRFLPRKFPDNYFKNPFKKEIENAKYVTAVISTDKEDAVLPFGYLMYEVTTDTIGYAWIALSKVKLLPDWFKEVAAKVISCFNPNSKYINKDNITPVKPAEE